MSYADCLAAEGATTGGTSAGFASLLDPGRAAMPEALASGEARLAAASAMKRHLLDSHNPLRVPKAPQFPPSAMTARR